MRRSSLIWLMMVTAICTNDLCAQSPAARPACTPFAVGELLREKEKLDGTRLCVLGRIHIEFEGNQISQGEKRIWLNFFSAAPFEEQKARRDWLRVEAVKKEFQDKCVMLRGKFNVKETGHFGMWPAGMDTVDDIQLASEENCLLAVSPKQTSRPTRQ